MHAVSKSATFSTPPMNKQDGQVGLTGFPEGWAAYVLKNTIMYKQNTRSKDRRIIKMFAISVMLSLPGVKVTDRSQPKINLMRVPSNLPTPHLCLNESSQGL